MILEWIRQNASTVIVTLIILAACAAVIRRSWQNKKAGKSSCASCNGCSLAGSCSSYKLEPAADTGFKLNGIRPEDANISNA